ncbi:MAG: hypothetical protein G3M70_13530 [Candidatus Nitronauta litoralis]|uniref:Zona occludens toxin N-terminal domain-containing protein n=1 Tax=Candidatus Nitronauta litoralis TaxID=2705533 RepID=A0A7T0BYJ0_9BACT|nr:MAG: hypothetical protein G3M70_13530 [Candidatus Nitronauta litoralis]
MPIYAFTGLMGAGKTYHKVRDVIIPAIKEKRRIYTNIPLRLNNIETFTDIEICSTTPLVTIIDGEFIKKIHHHQEELIGALVVIDELHTYFYSADAMWDKTLLEFLTYSRHHGIDVVFGTQNLENINKKFRNLVSNEYRFRAQSHLGFIGKGRYKMTKYVGTADSYQDPEIKPEETKHSYDKDVFKFYHSVEPGVLKSVGIPKQPIPQNNSVARWGVFTFGCLLLTGFLLSGLVSKFNGGGPEVAQGEVNIEVSEVPSSGRGYGRQKDVPILDVDEEITDEEIIELFDVDRSQPGHDLPVDPEPGRIFFDVKGREMLLKGKHKVMGKLTTGGRVFVVLEDNDGAQFDIEFAPQMAVKVGQVLDF